jgi:hypothetical protein
MLKNVFLSAVPYRVPNISGGGNNYKLPHMGKEKMARQGLLSPGHHCLSIGALQQRTRASKHGLITTGQYKRGAIKKFVNWTISLGRREYIHIHHENVHRVDIKPP